MKQYYSLLQILFVCLCLVPIRHADAQGKYLPGYVLLNNGDTVKGFIETENWKRSPVLIHFKAASNGEVHTYSPLLIRSFRIRNGEWYFSYAGNIDPSSLADDQLSYDPIPDTAQIAFFIRSIVMSKVCLYTGRDANDRLHLFLQKDNGIISELNYKKYYIDEVVVADYRNKITRRTIMANQIYKQQLAPAFSDCPWVAGRLFEQQLSYSKNDIMEAVLEYNRCKSSRVYYSEKKDAWKFEFGIHAGATYAGLKFKSDSNTYIGDANINGTVGFASGISLNCLLPRTKDSWSIYNELLVKNFTTTGLTGTAPFKEQKEVKMDLVYVKLINMARYQFQAGTVKPFLNFGISNGVAIKDENILKETAPPEPFLTSFRSYEQGLLLGGGIRWKKYAADLRVEFSNGMSGYSDVKSNMTTGYLLLGYIF